MADAAGRPVDRPSTGMTSVPAMEIEFEVEYGGNVYSVRQDQIKRLSLEIPDQLSVRVRGELVVLPVVRTGASALTDRVSGGALSSEKGGSHRTASMGLPLNVSNTAITTITELPLDSRLPAIDEQLDVIGNDITDPENFPEIGDKLGALAEVVADYKKGIEERGAQQYTITKIWNAVTTWTEDPIEGVERKLSEIKSIYSEAGWNVLLSLYTSAISGEMSKDHYIAAKDLVIKILTALDTANCVEVDPRYEMMMARVEQEFGVLGLTKRSRDRIQAAASSLQERIDSTKELAHFVITHNVDKGQMNIRALLMPGIESNIAAGVQAFNNGIENGETSARSSGLAALAAKAEELSFSSQDLMSILRVVCDDNFHGKMFISELTHPDLIFVMLLALARERDPKIQLKSLYRSFPIVTPCLKEMGYELETIIRQIQMDHATDQATIHKQIDTCSAKFAGAQLKLAEATTPKQKRVAREELETLQATIASARAKVSQFPLISQQELIQVIFFPSRYRLDEDAERIVTPAVLGEAIERHGRRIKRVLSANPLNQP